MQKKQLQILRHHGELWTVQDFNNYSKKIKKDKGSSFGAKENIFFKGNHLQSSVFSSIPINDEYYCVDQKIFKVLEETFENYLYERNSDVIYQEWIKNKLSLYSPLKEDKIRLLCNEIIGMNEELDFLLTEAFGIQIPMPTDGKQLKSNWHLFLSNEDVASLLELLKFDIFEGERIESFGYPFLREAPEKSCLMDIYFSQHDKIQMLCEIVSLIENINYLNKLIGEFENPVKNIPAKNKIESETQSERFTYKEIALACKFSKINLLYLNNAQKYLELYGKNKDEKKLLQKVYAFGKMSDGEFSKQITNKRSNSLHRNSLYGTERLIKLMKDPTGKTVITPIIAEFERKYIK